MLSQKEALAYSESSKDQPLIRSDEQSVVLDGEFQPSELFGQGFSYRHDWGNRNGWWTLNLNWNVVTKDSRVFVSATEFSSETGGSFIGNAIYTVHNVAPYDGGVSIRLHIDFDRPIRVYVSYLAVK